MGEELGCQGSTAKERMPLATRAGDVVQSLGLELEILAGRSPRTRKDFHAKFLVMDGSAEGEDAPVPGSDFP